MVFLIQYLRKSIRSFCSNSRKEKRRAFQLDEQLGLLKIANLAHGVWSAANSEAEQIKTPQA